MGYAKNDILTVKIEDMGNDGEGIGKTDGEWSRGADFTDSAAAARFRLWIIRHSWHLSRIR